MDIKEIPAVRKKLENDLRDIMINRLDQFKKETGLEVENIYVRIEEMTAIGDAKKSYDIINVEVKIFI